MSMRSWIRTLFAPPVTRPTRKASHRSRLSIEALEDRAVPATFTVLNTLDDGSTGSLRWAVGQANTTTGADTIAFNNDSSLGTNFYDGTQHTITLSGSDLELTDSATTTITGPGQGLLTISGNQTNRSFNIFGKAALSGMTMTDGIGTAAGQIGNNGDGGGVQNFGTASLTDCTITGNSVTAVGGGVANFATLTMTDCTVSHNTAGLLGGGVFNAPKTGMLTLNNCTISDNNTSLLDGGGLVNFGTLTMTDSTVRNNHAPATGGGLGNRGDGVDVPTLNMTNCTFSGNSAATGGGGLATDSGTATLTNCTFTANSAGAGGGAIVNDELGTLNVTSCTISGNTAGDGGGIHQGTGTLTLGNSIVSGNSAPAGKDIHGVITTDVGNNLLGAALSGTTSGAGDVFRDAPLLSALGNYGGPTQTMALLPGSPAIDAGSGTGPDQRGVAVVNNIRDVGAFESGGFTIAVTSGSGQSTVISTAFSAPLVVTVTANNHIEPVAGGQVTFTAPASGASAVLSGSPATIGSDGTASVTATANGAVGSYTVSATASGISNSASFGLTNRPNVTLLEVTAWTQGTINIGSNGSIVLHLAIADGQLTGSDTAASLFDRATFTIAIQKADGSVTYGTLTSQASVDPDGTINVSMRMDDTLRAELYDAYVNGRAVNFNLTATSNGGGEYAIDADTMSRLLNNGALRYVV
jgi:hypothetical protein